MDFKRSLFWFQDAIISGEKKQAPLCYREGGSSERSGQRCACRSSWTKSKREYTSNAWIDISSECDATRDLVEFVIVTKSCWRRVPATAGKLTSRPAKCSRLAAA
jgi:hypothetical protein